MQKTFRFSLELRGDREDLRVFIRGKEAIGAKTPWHPWIQMYPSLRDLKPQTPHSPEVVPPIAANKDWDDLKEKVAPTLSKWVIRLGLGAVCTLVCTVTHTHTHTHQVL